MQKSLSIVDGLNLPLESVSRSFGILAMRGAGKSNAAAVMAEELRSTATTSASKPDISGRPATSTFKSWPPAS